MQSTEPETPCQTTSCSVAECDAPYHARGWCQSHYNRWYHSGDPLPHVSKTHIRGEEWRNVSDFEGVYEVSSFGRVRRVGASGGTNVGRVLKAYSSGRGYLAVSLSIANRTTRRTIHSMVAQAFIGPRLAHMVIRHLDGDMLNNRRENLAYGTSSENVFDSIRHGTYRNGMAERTHCPSGHPYDEANTRIKHRNDGHRERVCRTCNRLRGRK